MQCFFKIKNWAVSSNRPHTPEQWQAWAVQQSVADLPERAPEVAFMPAMQRRRLGLPARLLFEAAHQALAGCDALPCATVSASHDGEIARSLELWLALLKDGTVSPTSFGLSVHNAVLGQWSMWRGDTGENTSLAVLPDGLETAVAEAVAILQDGAKQVLVVVADTPAAVPLRPVVRAPFAYALALLLEAGDEWCLRRSVNDNAALASDYWGALSWVRHRLLAHRNWTHDYGNRLWHWSQHP